MSTFLKTLLTITLLPLSLSVSANNMLLDRMIVYFEPGKTPRQDIRVTNISNENLYLQTEIYKVLNPGAENEERIRVTNPDEMRLLTTPQKSVVKPRGQRSVRLINLDTPREKEDVYRVTFRPVTAEVEANQNAIQLLVAYQALVFVRPEKPVYNVIAERKGEKVTFTNTGNSNVILRNGEQCLSDAKDAKCVEITSGGRIYAGESISLDLPKETGKVISFGVFDGTREQRKEFRL